MAKELPYFQFEPAQYLSGSIQFCSLPAQGLFANITAIYWQRECSLTLDQLKKRFTCHELIQELIDEKILKLKDGSISIKFLDDQYNAIAEISNIRSQNGYKGAKAKWQKDGKTIAPPLNGQKQTDGKHMALRGEEIREDKIRGEESNKKTTPTLDDFKSYFTKNNFPTSLAEKAFKFYNDNDWKDSQGNKVTNWKQKVISVWFKEEDKIKPRRLQH